MGQSLSVFPSGWGWIGIAVSERGLAGLILPRLEEEEVWTRLRAGWPDGTASPPDAHSEWKQTILDYLAGKQVDFSSLALDLPAGSPFHRRVWEACARIPYGETRSYAQLAGEAGSPRAFRAVGAAMATNPIPIVIPCHRVVGSDGSLVGFGGGVEQKRRMLEMESAPSR